MRKRIPITAMFLLMLFVAMATTTSDISTLDEPARALQQAIGAADGDELAESVLSFTETISDDSMFLPDNETTGSGYAEKDSCAPSIKFPMIQCLLERQKDNLRIRPDEDGRSPLCPLKIVVYSLHIILP